MVAEVQYNQLVENGFSSKGIVKKHGALCLILAISSWAISGFSGQKLWGGKIHLSKLMHSPHPTIIAVWYMSPLNKYRGCSPKILVDIHRIGHHIYLITKGFFCNRQTWMTTKIIHEYVRSLCSLWEGHLHWAFSDCLSLIFLLCSFQDSDQLADLSLSVVVHEPDRSLWSLSVSLSGI